jgi:serine/threonine-protein kinase
MSQITCLRCKNPIDSQLEQCPNCGERVTMFQRTYSDRLLDGKYQIIDRLGVGGMGEIFKVRHIHLNELRVIKIMRPNVAADDQGLQRFLQEARTSTTIKHRNLAMLYDFAQLDDGSYYMVWEFIDGTNIQKWIAQNGPIPPRLTVEMAIQALNGLEYLHSMGLIHRDISPENIMLSQDHHGKLLVKVIDFGIAKQLGEGNEQSGQGLTQTGMFLGKLKYASPEQAGFLKEGERLDPRSDLYSFGIVMYEMLAGRAPFQATNPHGYILKHVTEKPAPIGETNPGAKVPANLESIIMRSLEKQRDTRYATAGEFANALEAIRNTIPPDQKYGLGERMVTLSGAQTLADLPKFTAPAPTASGASATQQTQTGAPPASTLRGTEAAPRVGPTGTKVAAEQATLMERKTIGSDEATVMERGIASQAAPTSLEKKIAGPAAAEPTLMERIQPIPAKSNRGMMIGIAAAVVVVAGIVIAVMMHKPPTVTPSPVPTASATVISTAPPTGTTPVPAGQGVLLLSASPWGDIEKIVDENGVLVDLSDEKRSTPTRIELAPGKYSVTVVGPSRTETFNVEIPAGGRVPIRKNLGGADINELEKEIVKP